MKKIIFNLCFFIFFCTNFKSLANDSILDSTIDNFKIIVPFVAGGPADVLARVLGKELSKIYKVPVIVENKPGANGSIGVQHLLKSNPNGKTLLLIPQGNLTILPNLLPNLGYKNDDFVPITTLAKTDNVIAVNSKFPVNNLEELIKLAKKESINYASPGVGSSLHFVGELLSNQAKIDLIHIAYKGSSQAVNDVLSGDVPMIISNLTSVLPYLKTGNLKAIAVTDENHSKFLPDVPTLVENNLNIKLSSWYALVAPKNTSKEVTENLSFTIENIFKTNKEVQKKLELQGLVPWIIKTDDFSLLIEKETKIWLPIINKLGIVINK